MIAIMRLTWGLSMEKFSTPLPGMRNTSRIVSSTAVKADPTRADEGAGANNTKLVRGALVHLLPRILKLGKRRLAMTDREPTLSQWMAAGAAASLIASASLAKFPSNQEHPEGLSQSITI